MVGLIVIATYILLAGFICAQYPPPEGELKGEDV
jgi:hypothetical protein